AGKHIDRRTDVFALGVIAWELLTGMRLFRRETNAATYMAVLQDPIPDIRATAPAVPEAIAAAVQRALERERDKRFPTAEAFREALARARETHRLAEGSQDDLAQWVRTLVPPASQPADLEREIVNGSSPGASGATSGAGVPELDFPVRAAEP